MPCKKCQELPGYHSFQKFGMMKNANLFYTSPAKAGDRNEDGAMLANIKLHIKEDTEQKPWIWVLDCGNMKVKHYTDMAFNIKLLKIISKDPNLQGIWILRPNVWIRTTASFLKTISPAKILKNTRYFEETGLELLCKLQEHSLENSSIQWLLKQYGDIY
jgi:hypothetical protein